MRNTNQRISPKLLWLQVNISFWKWAQQIPPWSPCEEEEGEASLGYSVLQISWPSCSCASFWRRCLWMWQRCRVKHEPRLFKCSDTHTGGGRGFCAWTSTLGDVIQTQEQKNLQEIKLLAHRHYLCDLTDCLIWAFAMETVKKGWWIPFNKPHAAVLSPVKWALFGELIYKVGMNK